MRPGAGWRGTAPLFRDREDAGRRLAARLAPDPMMVVLGIARGGVAVAREIARVHGAPLDALVVRKLGAPSNPELGVGAVVSDGTTIIDPRTVRMLDVSEEYLRAEAARQLAEARRRLERYRGDRPPLTVSGRTCVVADDGMATGGTAEAAVRSLLAGGATRVVVAVPVAAVEAVRRLDAVASEVIALATPLEFLAVGQWYQRFEQLDDDAVVAALEDLDRP